MEADDRVSLTISLPASLVAFIEAQVSCGSYADPSEYLCALIREAQTREALLTDIDLGIGEIERGECTVYDASSLPGLVREVRIRGREALEQKLLEGLDSGEPSQMTAEDWAEIRRQVDERLQAEKPA